MKIRKIQNRREKLLRMDEMRRRDGFSMQKLIKKLKKDRISDRQMFKTVKKISKLSMHAR